jgi:hypothetical protein
MASPLAVFGEDAGGDENHQVGFLGFGFVVGEEGAQ